MTELESRLINEVKTLNEKFDMLLDAVTKSSSVAVGSNKTFGVWLNEWYEAYKIPKETVVPCEYT